MTAKEMFANTMANLCEDGPGKQVISPDATANMIGLLAVAAAIEGLTEKLSELAEKEDK